MRRREDRAVQPPPKPSGPREEQFIYVLPLERQHALAERASRAAARAHERFWAAPGEEAEAGMVGEAAAPRAARPGEPGLEPWGARRGARAKAARASGRRFGTVSRRTRSFGDPVPDLRISGFWLREAGFDFGQEYEIEVGTGTLTVRALPPARR